MEKGNTVAEVLKLSHKRPDPGHKGHARRPARLAGQQGLQEGGSSDVEVEEEERNGKNVLNSEYFVPNLSNLQVSEGPGAWGVLQEEEEKLGRRGRALHAQKLPKGTDKVEFLDSSVHK